MPSSSGSPPDASETRKRRAGAFRTASTWLNVSIVGIQFPVAIAIGFFFGRWLDGSLGTAPWLTVLFTLFGVIAGFVNLFRITAAASRSEEDQLRPELGIRIYPPEDDEDDDDRDD
jgi:ATP synthase protein I